MVIPYYCLLIYEGNHRWISITKVSNADYNTHMLHDLRQPLAILN